MEKILERISECIQSGKVDRNSPYPPAMKEMEGADELTYSALEMGIAPDDVLDMALIPAMEIVGERFARNEIFVPQMLMSAKAMGSAMKHLRPFFQSGETRRKGTFVVGTVAGDLHDIGKNLLAMIVEGGGWEVIDLGVDVKPGKFMEAAESNPGCHIGLSALLTTTMENMKEIVREVKMNFPATHVLVGGAPVTQDYCDSIGADFYSPDPQGAVRYLNSIQG